MFSTRAVLSAPVVIDGSSFKVEVKTVKRDGFSECRSFLLCAAVHTEDRL